MNRYKLPDYLRRQLAFVTSMNSPQEVDLNTVDPAFRPYYEQFNNLLRNLKTREDILRREAATAQQTAIDNTEAQLTSLINQKDQAQASIREGLEDMLTQNRMRARAMGGAPSSSLLDINARTEREALRQMGNLQADYANRIIASEKETKNKIDQIENELLKQLAAIESDRSLSIRQRDELIEKAKMEAMRAARGAVGGGFDFGGLNSVLGISDTATATRPVATQQTTVPVTTQNYEVMYKSKPQPQTLEEFRRVNPQVNEAAALSTVLSGNFDQFEGAEAVDYYLNRRADIRNALAEVARRNPKQAELIAQEMTKNPYILRMYRDAKDAERKDNVFLQARSTLRELLQPLPQNDNSQRIIKLINDSLNRSLVTRL